MKYFRWSIAEIMDMSWVNFMLYMASIPSSEVGGSVEGDSNLGKSDMKVMDIKEWC